MFPPSLLMTIRVDWSLPTHSFLIAFAGRPFFAPGRGKIPRPGRVLSFLIGMRPLDVFPPFFRSFRGIDGQITIPLSETPLLGLRSRKLLVDFDSFLFSLGVIVVLLVVSRVHRQSLETLSEFRDPLRTSPRTHP